MSRDKHSDDFMMFQFKVRGRSALSNRGRGDDCVQSSEACVLPPRPCSVCNRAFRSFGPVRRCLASVLTHPIQRMDPLCCCNCCPLHSFLSQVKLCQRMDHHK